MADARGKNKPLQSDLRRAVSTTYYAMFHCLAKCCADLMVGTASADRSDPAWKQVYRSLGHTTCKDACKNKGIVAKFPQQIQDFANHFVAMQIKRHEADYDPKPASKYHKSAVLNDITATESCMNLFAKASVKDRRAFAAWVLLKPPRS